MNQVERIHAPTSDKVFFRKLIPEETAGGIHVLPDGYAAVLTGEVIAVGPGKLHHKSGVRLPMQVKVGDLIIYETNLALKVDVRDREEWHNIRWIPESSILGITDKPLYYG